MERIVTTPPNPLSELLVQSELLHCHRCGYCMATCPTYRALRDERQVARGRNEIVRQVAGGRLKMLPELRDPIFECLLCGACTETCFSNVKTDEIIVRAREAWQEEHGQPAVQRLIFDQLLPYPRRLTSLMRMLSLGKRSGLAELAHRLGILRWINATLEGANGLVGTMPRRFLRDRLYHMGFRRQTTGGPARWVRPRDAAAPAPGPAVLYFIGCGTNFQVPAQGEAAMRVLAAAGCELTVVENVCCGLPPYSYGDRDAARSLAGQNLEVFQALDFDYMLTECGSCSAFIKKWPSLLEQDREQADAARSVAARTRDFTQLLPELRLPAGAEALPGKYTYHDPCHLRRGQGIYSEPRALLTDVARVDLVELKEADWCCGGAGSYNLAHPELSLEILERKMGRIGDTGAGTVVTACPACVIQLSYGARRQPQPLRVRHIAQVLAEACGMPVEN